MTSEFYLTMTGFIINKLLLKLFNSDENVTCSITAVK